MPNPTPTPNTWMKSRWALPPRCLALTLTLMPNPNPDPDALPLPTPNPHLDEVEVGSAATLHHEDRQVLQRLLFREKG